MTPFDSILIWVLASTHTLAHNKNDQEQELTMMSRSFLVLTLFLLSACQTETHQSGFSGYATADYLYLSPTAMGKLSRVFVKEGQFVNSGDPLFSLETEVQTLSLTAAQQKVQQTQALWRDQQLGARPEEIHALQAQLAEANATLVLAEAERKRWASLVSSGNATDSQGDQAEQNWAAAKAHVRTVEANIAVARLGAREQQQVAAKSAMELAETELALARWHLNQQTTNSPQAGWVERRLFDPGEQVSPTTPVIQLRTDTPLNVRFYVPQAQLSAFQTGQKVKVRWDGQDTPVAATIRTIAAEAEFTPPVIFSNESRSKLVFEIEAELNSHSRLHAGQPVEVALP